VVPEEANFVTVCEAIQGLDDDPKIIWVTGPSKTADIEGILIEGVHGPGEQVCYPA
jgi:L-lactate dehydrogenase complex protein LldG